MKEFMSLRAERSNPCSQLIEGDCFASLATTFPYYGPLLLASCAPAPATPGEAEETPTAVMALDSAIQLPAAVEATPRPTVAPFRFVLPTPGAEPVSGWRPPLYPVPWAVSAYDHFYFIRPIAADNVNWPLAEYRYGGVFFAPDVVHTGVDIGAEEGAQILAAGPGTVVSSGWGLFSGASDNINDPYGKAVVIKHDFGYKGQTLYTIYAHMSETIALVGQHVETGDVIGLVGSTGARPVRTCISRSGWAATPSIPPTTPNCGCPRRRAGVCWSGGSRTKRGTC
jgi:hypothetical protein